MQSEDGKTRQPHLLLVEDEAVLAFAQCQSLRSKGFQVKHTLDPEATLQHIIDGHSVDLVLMDIQLSAEVDGIQLAEQILSFAKLPILFLSNYTEAQTLGRLHIMKHYGFVPKHVSPAVLECMIHSALHLFQTEEQLTLRESQLRQTLDSVSAAVLLLDGSGSVLDANHSAEILLGRTKASLLGQMVGLSCDLRHPESHFQISLDPKFVFEIRREKLVHEGLLFTNRFGKQAVVNLSYSPILGLDGVIEAIVLVLQEAISPGPLPLQSRGPIADSLYKHAFTLSPVAMAITSIKDGKYLDINPALEVMFGLSRDEVIGRPTEDFIHWDVDGERERMRSLFLATGSIYGEPMTIRNKDGSLSQVLVFAKPFNIEGESYIIGMNLDVTERMSVEKKLEKSLQEKEILLKELQHRVKNSLTIVSGLLNMEAFKMTDERAKLAFLNAQSRIISMSKVYENLYQSEGLDSVNLNTYLNHLLQSMVEIFDVNPTQITFELALEDIFLDVKRALPLGLILNELLTNCIKYAFPDGRKGVVWIRLFANQGHYLLNVSDNGIGLTKDVDIKKGNHFGFELIRSLTSQLRGVFSSLSNAEGQGLSVQISIPMAIS